MHSYTLAHAHAYKHVRACVHPNKSNGVYHFRSSVVFFFVVYFFWIFSIRFYFLLFCCVQKLHIQTPFCVWICVLFRFVSFRFISFHLPLTRRIDCSRTNLKLNSFRIDLVSFFHVFVFFCCCLAPKFVAGIFSGLFCFIFPFRLVVNSTHNKYLLFSYFWWEHGMNTKNFFRSTRKKIDKKTSSSRCKATMF